MSTFLNQPWPYLATAAFSALIIVYVLRHPHRPGARWLSWLVGVFVVWALVGALATVTPSIQVLYGLFVLQSVCALFITALELTVVLEYTGNEKWITRRTLLLLIIPPLLFVVLAFTSPESMASIAYYSGSVVFVGQAVVKWGFYAYIAIIFLIDAGVLLTCLMRAPAFHAPILLLIVGALIPLVGYAFIRPEWFAVSPIQACILLVNVTMLAYFVALYSFRILQARPVARDMLISWMPFGLIVLDSENHLVDFNAATQALPGLPGKLILQRTASQALGDWWDRLAPLISPESISQDFIVQTSHGSQTFHVISRPLLQASGWRLGQVFLVEDVTKARQEQQQQEQTQRSLATLKERERVARELHDSLGQVLGFVKMQAQGARGLLARNQSAEADRYLEQLVAVTQDAHADVREYILGAQGERVGEAGFLPALAQYLQRFGNHCNIATELSVSPELSDGAFEPMVEAQLLRIIQEALTNVRKHARARSVRISLSVYDSRAEAIVQDDGVGLDPALLDTAEGQKFGLRFMRERAEEVGGSVQIHSAPGEGTQVIICVPLRKDEG